ncbi:Fibronectin type III domain-containing protein [Anaerocolumna jejuensis DSM 15929]|uniref:Fibronectin type III domain-containing protein n=1 Tax=Anaerocolumna jejuensis DSM 15929 TaxID=1121322 RepID=A0A1M6ZCC8_9FIRM|nr:Ig-like domain-containing protein [Anaerocolumna jejuensis]SHL28005.1 Fibronectin type III domain-containing protein [Anaerocolumna jejuensis DSM 15929]
MKKSGLLRKGIIAAVSIILAGSELANPIPIHYTNVVQAETADSITPAAGINVARHTKEEILAFLNSSGATAENPVVYNEKPSNVSPYNTGSLSDETLNSAVKMLNQIRYIAGISYNVTLNEDYNAKTQAASLVNSVNGALTHTPSKPSGMDDSLYQLGAKGAGSSNIALGYDTINGSLVYGYMEDGDSSNIDRVGHRRWILNPPMSATGFGYCNGYSAMYAFDKKNTSAAEYGVAWPAQTMPADYFSTAYPWSISMGYEVNKENVQVTLVRLRDNKTWNFSSALADGYFNVNNSGYGQTGCIIFRPDGVDAYGDGDQFQVTIAGLKTPVSYQVSFFDLVPSTAVKIKKNNTKLNIGSSIYLDAEISPSNASNKMIKWTSSDESVAVVSDYGEVEGKGYGNAAITATCLSSGLSADYTVTVVPNPIGIDSVTSQKKQQITVSYTADKSVSGYEVTYAANEKFTKSKTTTVKKPSSSRLTITGLKSGKIYYVRIRAYYIKSGKKIYGDYGYTDNVWVK